MQLAGAQKPSTLGLYVEQNCHPRQSNANPKGTGTWAILLARHHPYADVVGVECVTSQRALPSQVADISISWTAFTQPVELPHGNVDFYTVGEHLIDDEFRFHSASLTTDVTQPLPWPDNTFGELVRSWRRLTQTSSTSSPW